MSKQTDLLNLTDGISVDASGNVGIGTSSPSSKLELSEETAPTLTFERTLSVGGNGVLRSVGNTGVVNAQITLGGGPNDHMLFETDGAERMRIDASGNVGIGTSSPNKLLHLKANTPVVNLHSDNASSAQISFTNSGGVSEQGFIKYEHDGDYSGNMQFRVAGSEAMRIDASGKLLVGKTADDNTSIGLVINGNGYTKIVRSSATANVNSVLQLNRLTSDGYILALQKDGTTVGNIGTDVGRPYFVGVSSGVAFGGTQAAIWPTDSSGVLTDNAYDVGSSGVRFDDIYATNGTIQTSDRNEKEAIASLTPTEMLVAARLSSSFKNFKWKDAVAEKGLDAARMHSGIIAQDVQDAFAAEGLDASDYAMFISGTWWETQTDVPAVEAVVEVVDEDGVVVTEAVEAKEAYTRTDTYHTLEEAPEGATERTRLGIRYPELLAFVAAYNDQRFLTIEARLTALEAT